MSWDKLRAEAFGEIGINPREFYRMQFSDYLLLKQGFFNKQVNDQRVIRKAVAIVISPWLKEMVSEFRLWPLPYDQTLISQMKEYNANKKFEVSEASMKILKQFKDKEESQKSKEN